MQATKFESEELRRERLIDHAAGVYGHAANYDNVIIVAGYVAFFALWQGVAADVTPQARLLTCAGMGVSLLIYIGWTIAQMLVRQNFEHERADILSIADTSEFHRLWEDNSRRHKIAELRLIRFWPYTFVPTVILGVGSALTLTWNAFAAAFGLPQLGW